MTRPLLIALGLLLPITSLPARGSETSTDAQITALIAKIEAAMEKVETPCQDSYTVVAELKLALKNTDAEAFKQQLAEITEDDAWAIALTVLSDATQSPNQEIREAAVAALAALGRNCKNETLACQAVEVLARTGSQGSSGRLELTQLLPSIYFSITALLVACALWGLSLAPDAILKWLNPPNQPQDPSLSLATRLLKYAFQSLAVVAVFVSLFGGPAILWYAFTLVPEGFVLGALLTVSGAFGGLLVSIRYEQVYLPHRKSETPYSYDLGVIADCLFGVAGASVVFLVVPGAFDLETSWTTIKVIATAIVGGFAGRALVEKVASQTVKDLKEMKEGQAQFLKDSEANAAAYEVLGQQLDPDGESLDEKVVKEAIAKASRPTRAIAFEKARKFTSDMHRAGKLTTMLNAKPVFEGLIEADKEQIYHGNFAHLAYLAKDEKDPDLPEAIKQFTKAIEIRDKVRETSFRWYEYCRAACQILADGSKEEIINDLMAASADPWEQDELNTRFSDNTRYRLQKEEEGDEKLIEPEFYKQMEAVMDWLDKNDAWGLVKLERPADRPKTDSGEA